MKNQPFAEILAPLSTRRQKLGLSQDEVAALAGITQTTMSTLERRLANPRLSTLQAAARALGMDVRLVPRELLPRVDDLLRAFSRPDATGADGERPLYVLEEDEGEDLGGEDEARGGG